MVEILILNQLKTVHFLFHVPEFTNLPIYEHIKLEWVLHLQCNEPLKLKNLISRLNSPSPA